MSQLDTDDFHRCIYTSGYILLIFYQPQLGQDFLQTMLVLIFELTLIGAAGASNVAGGTSGVASAFSSIVVNFLGKKLSRFFIKLLSRFFRRLLLKFFFFFQKNVFGCKNRAALATTSRRPQRNAVIPATDGNAELVMKKSPCLLNVCPFAKFPRRPF